MANVKLTSDKYRCHNHEEDANDKQANNDRVKKFHSKTHLKKKNYLNIDAMDHSQLVDEKMNENFKIA
jgi:hypothetical protein